MKCPFSFLLFAAPLSIFAAGTADLQVSPFAQATGTDVIGGGVPFRFAPLAGEATAAQATHVLIEGLLPLASDSNAFASTYSAVNLANGATHDVGMVYLEMPEASGLPSGVAASPIVGIVARSGSWDSVSPSFPTGTTLGSASGSVDYDAEAGTLALSLTSGGTAFSGATTYTIVDDNTVEMAALTLTGGTSPFNYAPATLRREGSRFYGVLEATDAEVSFDSLLFDLEIPDIPDADGDGLPDLVDLDITGGLSSLVVAEDNWVLNEDTLGWVFGTPGASDEYLFSGYLGTVYYAAFPWIYSFEWEWIFFVERRSTGENSPDSVDFWIPSVGFVTVFVEAQNGWFYSWDRNQYNNFRERRDEWVNP